ncbi:hypothetical protein [Amycolatopsis sp. cmx-4-68]|uniref:hypothetical protein n=1 Tax=Amycolatopsis sp. cmx-4-68 TaxID=2790938 RepID=UPI00397C04E5
MAELLNSLSFVVTRRQIEPEPATPPDGDAVANDARTFVPIPDDLAQAAGWSMVLGNAVLSGAECQRGL